MLEARKIGKLPAEAIPEEPTRVTMPAGATRTSPHHHEIINTAARGRPTDMQDLQLRRALRRGPKASSREQCIIIESGHHLSGFLPSLRHWRSFAAALHWQLKSTSRSGSFARPRAMRISEVLDLDKVLQGQY